jgi:hypothetical protein
MVHRGFADVGMDIVWIQKVGISAAKVEFAEVILA